MAERPLKVLVSWLDWWRIDHWTVKAINYRIAPLSGIIAAVAAFALPSRLNLWGENGAIWLVNGLLQPLVGFFIAALAAVATFQRFELDELMGADPPQLSRNEGKSIEDLTRRRFLCLLFGYLSGISICLYVAGVFVIVIDPVIREYLIKYHTVYWYARAASFGVYSLFFIHMIITAFLGLYFLVDRMHQPSLKSGFRDDPNRMPKPAQEPAPPPAS